MVPFSEAKALGCVHPASHGDALTQRGDKIGKSSKTPTGNCGTRRMFLPRCGLSCPELAASHSRWTLRSIDLPLIPHCIAFAPGGQTAHPANRASDFRGHQDRPASGTGFQELNWVRLRYPPTPLAAGGARQRRKYMKLSSARGKNLSADPTEAGGSVLEKQCQMESLKAGEERMRKG